MQNDRLNRGYCMLLSVFTIFAPLQPHKITFAAVFFIRYVCEYLIYRETPKSVLFARLQPFSSLMIYVILSFYFDTVAAVFFCIRFLSLFVSRNLRETLCKFLNVYASLKCMFMQDIMINRKLCGNFEFSLHLYRNVLSFYFLFLCFFSYFG